MKQYTLVVVDMQPDFPASCNPRTLAAVAREIKTAMRLGLPIIFLEVPYLTPCADEKLHLKPTHACLMDLVQGYALYQVEEKLINDGSAYVEEVCQQNSYFTNCFRVCGVNTDVCVLDTLRGLAARFPGCWLEMILDACNTTSDSVDGSRFSDFSNLSLLPGNVCGKAA